jgi:hypothetical protein
LENELLFEVDTPLGFSVRVSQSYWEFIVTVKHPTMAGMENEVQTTLREPEEVRRSRSDANVYLFYRKQNAQRWFCAVVRRLNGDGFLITTYPTDAIKAGETIWRQ